MAVKRKPRLKFFAILGGFVVVAAVLMIVLLRGQPTAAIEWASTDYTAYFDMLVVRSEVVYEAKNYGKTDFIAKEGAHVKTGDPILEVYELGYNDETLSELLDLKKTIMDYETGVSRAGVIDTQLNDINNRIDSKAKDIQQAVAGRRFACIPDLEDEMEVLLDERTAYLKSVAQPDDTLRTYYAKEYELSDMIAGWCSVLTAEESGIVSFYFDGCEALMTKDNIGSFTKEVLEEVSEGKTIKTVEQDRAYAPLYRLVNENDWYVVTLCDKSIPEMFIGNVFSIVFDDYLKTQYTGTVYDATELEDNGGFVYTIQIQDSIGPLLGDRRVSAKLYTAMEGMRVPRSYVKATDQVSYVETTEGKIVPVFVIADDGEYVFIQTYQGQASLEIGQVLKK
ncbi:MAG: HlyD family efflux transporter periplasmic adaptor subunit [Christensenellales bacterium]|jgi:hypothetical protein